MMLVNDRVGVFNPKNLYDRFNVRCTKLCEIMDDDNATQERRDWAYEEYVGYQREMRNLKYLFKIPFDVLVVVEESIAHNKRKQ